MNYNKKIPIKRIIILVLIALLLFFKNGITCPVLVGLKLYPHNKVEFLYKSIGRKTNSTLKKQLDYFYTSLRIKSKNLWVNLQPTNEEKKLLGHGLELTKLGKALLQADLQLKKDAKSILEDLKADICTSRIKIRLWIVPGKIKISETTDRIYIISAKLAVKARVLPYNEKLNTAIKKLLPILISKVNHDPSYQELRSAFYSIILSYWIKNQHKKQIFHINNSYIYNNNTLWTRRNFLDKYLDLYFSEATNNDSTLDNYVIGGIDFQKNPFSGPYIEKVVNWVISNVRKFSKATIKENNLTIEIIKKDLKEANKILKQFESDKIPLTTEKQEQFLQKYIYSIFWHFQSLQNHHNLVLTDEEISSIAIKIMKICCKFLEICQQKGLSIDNYPDSSNIHMLIEDIIDIYLPLIRKQNYKESCKLWNQLMKYLPSTLILKSNELQTYLDHDEYINIITPAYKTLIERGNFHVLSKKWNNNKEIDKETIDILRKKGIFNFKQTKKLLEKLWRENFSELKDDKIEQQLTEWDEICFISLLVLINKNQNSLSPEEKSLLTFITEKTQELTDKLKNKFLTEYKIFLLRTEYMINLVKSNYTINNLLKHCLMNIGETPTVWENFIYLMEYLNDYENIVKTISHAFYFNSSEYSNREINVEPYLSLLRQVTTYVGKNKTYHSNLVLYGIIENLHRNLYQYNNLFLKKTKSVLKLTTIIDLIVKERQLNFNLLPLWEIALLTNKNLMNIAPCMASILKNIEKIASAQTQNAILNDIMNSYSNYHNNLTLPSYFALMMLILSKQNQNIIKDFLTKVTSEQTPTETLKTLFGTYLMFLPQKLPIPKRDFYKNFKKIASYIIELFPTQSDLQLYSKLIFYHVKGQEDNREINQQSFVHNFKKLLELDKNNLLIISYILRYYPTLLLNQLNGRENQQILSVFTQKALDLPVFDNSLYYTIEPLKTVKKALQNLSIVSPEDQDDSFMAKETLFFIVSHKNISKLSQLTRLLRALSKLYDNQEFKKLTKKYHLSYVDRYILAKAIYYQLQRLGIESTSTPSIYQIGEEILNLKSHYENKTILSDQKHVLILHNNTEIGFGGGLWEKIVKKFVPMKQIQVFTSTTDQSTEEKLDKIVHILRTKNPVIIFEHHGFLNKMAGITPSEMAMTFFKARNNFDFSDVIIISTSCYSTDFSEQFLSQLYIMAQNKGDNLHPPIIITGTDKKEVGIKALIAYTLWELIGKNKPKKITIGDFFQIEKNILYSSLPINQSTIEENYLLPVTGNSQGEITFLLPSHKSISSNSKYASLALNCYLTNSTSSDFLNPEVPIIGMIHSSSIEHNKIPTINPSQITKKPNQSQIAKLRKAKRLLLSKLNESNQLPSWANRNKLIEQTKNVISKIKLLKQQGLLVNSYKDFILAFTLKNNTIILDPILISNIFSEEELAEILLHEILVMLKPELTHKEHKQRYNTIQRDIMQTKDNKLKNSIRKAIAKILLDKYCKTKESQGNELGFIDYIRRYIPQSNKLNSSSKLEALDIIYELLGEKVLLSKREILLITIQLYSDKTFLLQQTNGEIKYKLQRLFNYVADLVINNLYLLNELITNQIIDLNSYMAYNKNKPNRIGGIDLTSIIY